MKYRWHQPAARRSSPRTSMKTIPHVSWRWLLTVSVFLTVPRPGMLAAQEPFVLWTRSAAGTGSPGAIAVSGSGEVLVLRGYKPQHLLRFSPQGLLVSSNAVTSLPGGWDSDHPVAQVCKSPDDALLLAGRGSEEGIGGFSVVKVGAAGEVIWSVHGSDAWFGALNNANAMAADATGGLLVGGSTTGPLTLGEAAVGDGGGPTLVRLAPDGRVLWVTRVEHQPTSGTRPGGVHDLAVDRDGNVVVSGFLDRGTANFGGTTVYPGSRWEDDWGDGFIAKYDASGKLRWVRLAGVQGTKGMSMAVDRQGCVYFLESSFRFGKLSPDGDLLWVREYPGCFLAMFGGIVIGADNAPVFTGEIVEAVRFDNIVLRPQNSSFQDLFVAKADVDGAIQWAMRGGGGTRGARGWNLAADHDGQLLLGAEIYGSNSKLDGLSVYGLTLAKLSEQPPLSLARSPEGVRLAWPAKATNHVLEAATTLHRPAWEPVDAISTIVGRDRQAVLDVAAAAARFFRLRKP